MRLAIVTLLFLVSCASSRVATRAMPSGLCDPLHESCPLEGVWRAEFKIAYYMHECQYTSSLQELCCPAETLWCCTETDSRRHITCSEVRS